MTTINLSLYEQEFDLAVESVLCKIAQNRKAIDMITNDDARNSLEIEQKILDNLMYFLNKSIKQEE